MQPNLSLPKSGQAAVELHNEASLKLHNAIAIIDVLAMTHCGGDPTSLNEHTESSLLLMAEQLVAEAKDVFDGKGPEVPHA